MKIYTVYECEAPLPSGGVRRAYVAIPHDERGQPIHPVPPQVIRCHGLVRARHGVEAIAQARARQNRSNAP